MNSVRSLLLAAALAVSAAPTFAYNEWNLKNPDKQKHFAAGAVTGMAGYAVCGRPCGYGFAMGLAVLKEVRDQRVHPEWPHGPDLAWHLVGTIVGVELGGNLIITPNHVMYRIEF